MFGISFEHLLILGIVLLIFGPRRLPELGHTLGKAIKNFKDSMTGVEDAQFRKLDHPDSNQDSSFQYTKNNARDQAPHQKEPPPPSSP